MDSPKDFDPDPERRGLSRKLAVIWRNDFRNVTRLAEDAQGVGAGGAEAG